ncbi:MAG: hypothetical protein ACE5KK_02060 [Candidatus Brocadiales bacterium]
MANKGIRVGDWGFFGLLIFASALAHFLFIFFVPTSYLLRTELFGGSYEPTPVYTPLIFEFVDAGDEVEELVKKEELWREEEQQEEQEKEVVEEVKRKQFVDTADSAVDEEVEAEGDLIGEKGTLARDTAPDEGPATEEPRVDGDSDVPAIGGLPGEGPGYAEGFAEMLADMFDVEEAEIDKFEESGEADIVTEGEELVEAESEEAISEDLSPDEDILNAEVATQETQTTEVESEVAQGTEAPEEGSDMESKLGLLEEKLDKDAEGLLTTRERPKELAYIPPMEPRERRQEVNKAQKRQKKTIHKKARKPKVAISFNAKTLSGGTIEPMYENKDANAPMEGQEAFTVMKDEYAPYYRHIRDRITWYWVLKYGTKAEINLETKNNIPIIIEFKVYPNGRIGTVKVVEEAGNHLLASYIRETIAETRLNKFPSYVDEEFIDVRFNFYFF